MPMECGLGAIQIYLKYRNDRNRFRRTHDDEESTAFIPSNLASAAEEERKRIHCWMFELVEPFHLDLTQYCAASKRAQTCLSM
jgi:hypothetical protein